MGEIWELVDKFGNITGTIIERGNDAHEEADIGTDNDVAKKLMKDFVLQEVIYKNRKRIIV